MWHTVFATTMGESFFGSLRSSSKRYNKSFVSGAFWPKILANPELWQAEHAKGDCALLQV